MGLKDIKLAILAAFVIFSLTFLSTTAFASVSLNVSFSPVVQTNYTAKYVTVYGSIVNTTTSDTITRINVTAVIGSNFNSQVTGSDGLFNFNVTGTTTVGEYTFNVTTNSSSLPNKTFTFYVSNSSTSTTTLTPIISFIGKFPPFTNGTTFTVNVTLFNETSPLTNYQPSVKIFQANGQNVSWTVTPVNPSFASNSSQKTNATGSIAFNVTIPSNANTGEYGISVDGGRAFTIFRVGSNYQIAVNTLTSSDETTSNFAPGSSVTILAKLRSSGNPVTGATVTAVITYPNGTTTRNITLTAHPSSEGFYNNSITDTTAQGTYKIKVGALKSTDNIIGSTTFNTKTFEGRIEPVKEFFFEWGGKSSFKPGQTVGLDLVTVNLTGGSILNWNSCSALNYTLLGITFANSTNSTLGNASVSYATDQYLPDVTVCRVSFTAPTTAGTYNIKVNVTLATSSGTENQTIDGFFSVSNFFLKITPILDLGGFGGFIQVVSPGTNITITLKAINVSNNTEIHKELITGHTVKRILPLEFTSGSSEITNINQTSYNGVNGTADSNITFTLPDNVIGPLLIETTATIANLETTTGTTFIIANYLNGFMGPQKGGASPTHEGEGANDFNSDALCSGTQTFSGSVTDTNTSTAAQGVVIVGIIQAREESTGKDVSSFISLVNTSASDSNGAISSSVTFSPSGGYSFSGNYFMVFNASYKGKYAGVPSFFMCRNLNMGFPQIKVIGSNQQFSWQVSPTSALNVTLTNVGHMNGSLVTNTSTFQSVLSLTQIFNFNPSTGTMQILKNATPLQTTFTNNSAGTANSASLTIYPQNYSLGGVTLTKWPNGFFDLRPRVVSNYGTDTGFGGFMVVAFDAFPEFNFGQSWAAGSTQSIVVRAATNVAGNSSSGVSAGFTISMGRPWEGQLVNVTITNQTLLADGWNNTNDTGNFTKYSECQNPQNCAGPYERWNVTFTVPNTLRKGGTMLSIRVISNATGLVGESVEVPLFVTVSKFNVILPNEEMVGNPASTMDAYFVKSDAWPATGEPTNSTNHGWNLAGIANTYGINSSSGRVCIKNTFNSTRLSQGSQTNLGLNATNSTKIVVIDAVTPGVYSTVILNRSNSGVNNITIVNMSSRSMGGQLYLWEIKGCEFFTMVNVSTSALLGQQGFMTNTGGGSHAAATEFTLPYVVISAGAPQNNVPVSVKSIAKQDNRGFGFEGKLSTSQFSVAGANTNSDGVAFVNVSITPSGKMIAFWSTTVGGESDSADMSSATFLEIKAISTSAQSFTPLAKGVVTLVNDTAGRTGLVGNNINWTFNATVTETADGDLVSNNNIDTWNVILNGSNNKTRITNSTPLTIGTDSAFNGTLQLTPIVGGSPSSIQTQLKIGEFNNGTAANNFTKTIVFYTATSGQNSYTVTSATQNISTVVCAQGFERPNGKPFENAILNVSVRDWSSFPPSTKYLSMFKLSDNSSVDDGTNPALTSPSGCIAVRVGPGQLGSWPSASAGKPPVFIEGTLTKGATSEFVYVGDVFRQ